MYIIKKNKDNKWAIKKKDSKRATKVFDTKLEAILYAKENMPNNYIVMDDQQKSLKSKKKAFWICSTLVLLVIIVVCVLFFTGVIQFNKQVEQPDNPVVEPTPEVPDIDPTPTPPSNIVSDDLQIYFLELGNYNAGDCTYIKAGDVDILIDAGSKSSSVPVIKNFINQYCTDNTLEYVIATHAHEDHIVGFTDQNSSHPGIFSSYVVETIIDFSLHNTNSGVYNNYITLRDQEIALGAKHYTASDCVLEQNGASKTFAITEDIELEVLDQDFYHKKSSDENNYSVCVQLTHGTEKFLFTGDLEAEGETSLVEKNELSKVKLFKGGHHGSATSSNATLLSEIQPEIVAVCCCAGSSEYTFAKNNMFPTQEFINRVAIYTDKIYVTTQVEFEIAIATTSSKGVEIGDEYMKAKSSTFKPLNGTIHVSSTAMGVTVECSHDNRVLKETDWFNMEVTLNGQILKMRSWPINGV